MTVDIAHPASFRHLRPSNGKGSFYFLLVGGLTALAVTISACGLSLLRAHDAANLGPTTAGFFLWAVAQILFAMAFLQWFVILHEAGHYTLFADRRWNVIAGQIAGFFSLIPFHSWRYIHTRHHRWTGWQDLDATTASLVPRELRSWERILIRLLWRSYLPFVSVIYRLSNYWYLPRMKKYVSPTQYRRAYQNVGWQLAGYALIALTLGPLALLSACGAGLVLSFVAQDVILLSQHTHLPQNLSEGRDVRPFLPEEQGKFTRSLRFPRWFSFLILNFDAHELHHEYVHVPGYELDQVHQRPAHEVSWWVWIREMRKIPGDTFLFTNRDQTGFPW